MSSRLNFKETEVVAIDSSSEDETRDQHAHHRPSTASTSAATTTVYANKTKKDQSKVTQQTTSNITSYDLFDLTKDSGEDEQPPKPKVESTSSTNSSIVSSHPEKKQKTEHFPSSTDIVKTDSTTPSAAESKKAEKRREKRKQLKEKKKAQAAAASTTTDASTEKPELQALLVESSDEAGEEVKQFVSKPPSTAEKPKVELPVNVSNFLQRFLSSKRASIDDFPVDDIEVSKDTYLQLFSEDFKGEDALQAAEEDADTDDGIEDVFQTTSYIDLDEGLALEALPMDFEVFNIYNLPYKIEVKEVESFLKKHGFPSKSVELGGDGNKKMPQGSACVKIVLPEGVTGEQCVENLQSKVCGGRQIRVQKAANDTKRRLSYGRELNNRYFESDISAKCVNCGEVGHRTYDCTNEALPVPCHLCAGIDHDPGNCPNLICYRCSSFGHHSRDCRNAGRPRPVVCFHCGSLNHDSFNCHELKNYERPTRYDTLLEGPWIRCMTCNKQDHLMCNKMPWERCDRSKVQQEIYCSNCGEQGHHVDYTPLLNDRWARVKYCVAPKCEAFFKFPQLKDVEDLLSENRDDWYRKMARGPSDINLFPSLTNPYSQDRDRRGGNQINNGSGGGYKRRQSEGHHRYQDDDDDDDDYMDDRYLANNNSNSYNNGRRVARFSEPDRRRSFNDSRGGYNNQDVRRDSYGSYSNNNNNHNNSNINNGSSSNKRKRFDDDGEVVDLTREPKRSNNNNSSYQAPIRSNNNDNSQFSKEWQERIENRKKRFSE